MAKTTNSNDTAAAFSALEQSVHAALETYSNVHRGDGHHSVVSTHLFEQARDIVLEYLGLKKCRFMVVFCTPARAATLMAQLKPKSYQRVSSREIGLPLGIVALAVNRKALPKGAPFQAGGGTTRVVARDWVVWANAPDRFEAGTPAIINIIAFAKALRLIRQFGSDVFRDIAAGELSANDILYHDELEGYSGPELLGKLRESMIGLDVMVPTAEGSRRYINLDNGASTPTFKPVWNAVCQAGRQPAKVQQDIIREVRSICAGMLGAPAADYDVIFNSNTTEAINLAAESLRRKSRQDDEPAILITILEHNSNDLPWRTVPDSSLIRLQVDAEGFLDLKELETLLCAYNRVGQYGKKRIRLVAVSGASNVLGVFNDLPEISRIVHQYEACLLVDAAQMVAHRRIEMEKWGIDYLAFSAHKAYAPFGTGVLVARKGLLDFNPAEMELITASGEENVWGIAALGKALVLLQRTGLELICREEQALTARILRGLAQIPGLTMYGIQNPESPRFAQKGGVIVFNVKGTMANEVAKKLALHGIGVRYGCHCAHLLVKSLVKISPALERFQGVFVTLFPKLRLPGITRVSLGIGNSEEDIDTLIRALGNIARQPRSQVPGDPSTGHPVTPGLTRANVRKQINDFVLATSQKVYGLH
jgi:selenocysteine lyase/cysteine desulfurase